MSRSSKGKGSNIPGGRHRPMKGMLIDCEVRFLTEARPLLSGPRNLKVGVEAEREHQTLLIIIDRFGVPFL